jgi:hypothetical protein
MMDSSAFDHHFKKIKAKWRTSFTDDMAIQIYQIVKHVPQEQFSKWIDSILWVPTAPTREAFYILARRFQSEEAKQELPSCEYCSNIGTVLADQSEVDGTVYTFAFACTFCQRGNNEPSIVPRWGEHLEKAGYKLQLSHHLKPDAKVINIKSKVQELVEAKDLNKVVNDDDVF